MNKIKKWFVISSLEVLPNDRIIIPHIASEELSHLIFDYLSNKYNILLEVREMKECSLSYPGFFRIGEPYMKLNNLNLNIRCHDFIVVANKIHDKILKMPDKNKRTYGNIQFFKTRFFEGILCLSMDELNKFHLDLQDKKEEANNLADAHFLIKNK